MKEMEKSSSKQLAEAKADRSIIVNQLFNG
jgi:hypothetical protein